MVTKDIVVTKNNIFGDYIIFLSPKVYTLVTNKCSLSPKVMAGTPIFVGTPLVTILLVTRGVKLLVTNLFLSPKRLPNLAQY